MLKKEGGQRSEGRGRGRGGMGGRVNRLWRQRCNLEKVVRDNYEDGKHRGGFHWETVTGDGPNLSFYDYKGGIPGIQKYDSDYQR